MSEWKSSVFAESARRETSVLFTVVYVMKLQTGLRWSVKRGREKNNEKQARTFVFSHSTLWT